MSSEERAALIQGIFGLLGGVLAAVIGGFFTLRATGDFFQPSAETTLPPTTAIVVATAVPATGVMNSFASDDSLTREAMNATADADQATVDAMIANNTAEPTSTSIPPTRVIIPTQIPSDTPVPIIPTDTSTPIPRATNTEVVVVPSNPTGSGEFEVQVATFDRVEMMYVPNGCFQIGWSDMAATENERRVSTECIQNDFWIDRYEVTNEQFEQFNDPSTNPSSTIGATYPVNNVTWYQASDFCELRGGRLPTEAEWEYAASGIENNIYPWGNDEIITNTVFADTFSAIQPVGSTGSTTWIGASDMGGNVAEWTMTISSYRQNSGDLDFDDPGEARYSYPYQTGDGRHVLPVASNLAIFMVVRGGSYSTQTLINTRTSVRSDNLIYLSSPTIGFRCVRTAN